jgi:hypothetical protein
LDNGPRSVAAIAQRDPEVTLMVVASGAYLRALVTDVAAARAALRCPEQLLVVSAGAQRSGTIDGNVLPLTASWQQVVGGARHSLNVRIARWILANVRPEEWTVPATAASLESKAAHLAKASVSRRTARTDSQICDYIRSQLPSTKPPSAWAMLHHLRKKGFACSQERFMRLFDTVVKSARNSAR